jgi:nucleoside-diphosphate-sugar epimerase
VHVFVTGGSGLTGPAVIRELIAAGHTVTGLARSDGAAARLEALGASSLPGSLQDLDRLRAGAERSDGVIHMAFSADRADPDARARHDVAAIDALGSALAGSGGPLVVTSGTLVMPAGQVSAETGTPDPNSIGAHRIPGERAALPFAERDVRVSVLRLAPTVHGPGDYGFVAALVAAARKTGVSAYVGDGGNRWPAVHRLDAARLYRLAMEDAPAGTALHGAAEGGVTLKSVADQIGQQLGVPSASLTFDEAVEHLEHASEPFGSTFLATILAADVPVSSDLTRALLHWEPTHYTLLEDLRWGDYTGRSSASGLPGEDRVR